MASVLLPDVSGCRLSAALLPLRVVVGVAFVLHGWSKIQHPLDWMGSESGVPGAFQAVAAVAEFGGGIALAVGLTTRLAAVGLIGVMVGALALAHIPRGDPFVGRAGEPSAEMAVLYLACSVLFAAVGPGRFSLDTMFSGLRRVVAEPHL